MPLPWRAVTYKILVSHFPMAVSAVSLVSKTEILYQNARENRKSYCHYSPPAVLTEMWNYL